MRRDRVAVLGTGGLFQDSLLETLAADRWFLVRGFPTDNDNGTLEQVNAFEPHAVLVVRSSDEPIPQAALSQMEKGVPIVTLDPKEPVITFSFKECKATASLDRVMEALRAALTLFSGRDDPVTASKRKRHGEGGATC